MYIPGDVKFQHVFLSSATKVTRKSRLRLSNKDNN